MSDYKSTSRTIRRISGGLFSKIVDAVLVSFYYGMEASFAGYSNVGLAYGKAHEDLSELNSETISKSLSYLKSRGLVELVREKSLIPRITESGMKRLNSITPQYDKKRTWDKRIYLVTYDLPKKYNVQRNLLRNYLKTIGCGMLQYSVWMTPYNPKMLIEKFVHTHNLDDELILVSSLGKNGTIGETGLKELITKIYDLEELNSRYLRFINDLNGKILVNRSQTIFSYLSILQDDPQIPFGLLPDNWEGDRAYNLFHKSIQVQK